ncbi:hypothetical protein [Pseudoflavitalea rhizosphaerae]|uniref:hypothetical protein n=1 Tax=Pseudoflavitalea rhizosphaerae TaxID=1884793 RepID=UPI000F8EAB62|nr:hypothetical protein [Pseudoflavitalea rhizosphaerae]
MAKKHFALAAFLLFGTLAVQAQQRPVEEPPAQKGFNRDNLFFGGNFGLSFGDYTLVNVSPQIGYRFNRYLAAGGGVNFLYSSYKRRYNVGADYKENYGNAGLNIFGRVYPIEYLLLQLQPEANYVWGKIKYPDGTSAKLDPQVVPSLLGGAGAVIPTGGRGSFVAMVQYDLLQNDRSPYQNRAFYTFGYNIGF